MSGRWVNVGVELVTGGEITTKRELTRLVAEMPSEVVLYGTSGFNGWPRHRADDLPLGVRFSVVGPDPRTRRWYATVERTDKGVRVS